MAKMDHGTGKINKGMKYLKTRDQLNEGIGRGSVILIKGNPIGGKRRLYATTIIGYNEFRPNAMMLFLSSDFYRIVESKDQSIDPERAGPTPRLKAIKTDYRTEESLKKALNLKTPNRISVVRNNNKTPFHWRTMQFTDVHMALRGVDNLLNLGEYILESENYEHPSDEEWDKFLNEIAKKTIRTIFNKSNEVLFMDLDMDVDLEDIGLQSSDEDEQVDW